MEIKSPTNGKKNDDHKIDKLFLTEYPKLDSMMSMAVNGTGQVAKQTMDLKKLNGIPKTSGDDQIKIANLNNGKSAVVKQNSLKISCGYDSTPKAKKSKLQDFINHNAQSLFESEKMSLITIKNEIDEAQSLYEQNLNNDQCINVNFFTKNTVTGARDDNITLRVGQQTHGGNSIIDESSRIGQNQTQFTSYTANHDHDLFRNYVEKSQNQ